MNKTFLVLFLAIAAMLGIIYFVSQKNIVASSTQVVTVRPNAADATLSDIVLFDPADPSKEEIFATMPGIFREHYHTAEYHNDTIYLIKRTGFADGKLIDDTWTDSLWKIDSKKNETKLASGKGLDFRVSENEKNIAVLIPNAVKPSLDISFIDDNGERITTMNSADMGLGKYELGIFPLFWADETLWFTAGLGPNISVINKIDNIAATGAQHVQYDVAKLGIHSGEFSLDPEKELIASSDAPAIFDADSMKNFLDSNKKVTLYTYNLNTKEKKEVTTTSARFFQPFWVGPGKLEFNDPNGEVDKPTRMTIDVQ